MDARYAKSMNSLLEKIAKRIRPSKEMIKQVDGVVSRINSAIKAMNIDAECVKGGSIAKDTFLKNDHDVDLFVRFSLNYPDNEISGVLSNILSKAFPKIKTRRVHGSRDYFQFKSKRLDYEIIPVAKIHLTALHEARNITDFSPFHVHWTASRMKSKPELSDEIRLAKIFCKANNVYGAESYIKGFSGHIIDILVIYYGSFLNLVKKFSSIEEISRKKPLIIDPENYLKNPLKELSSSKLSSLIIIDPIQKDRNAAAALSDEKINLFVHACKSFLESPSEKFFKMKKFSLKNIKVSKTHEKIVLDVNTLDGSKDVVGTKILKVYQYMIEKLRTCGFIVENSGWNFNHEKSGASIYFIVPKIPLSEYVEHPGPPVNNNEAYKRFCQVHAGRKLTIRNHRVYARIKRKHVHAKSYIKELLSEDYVSSRVVKMAIKGLI